MPSVIAGSGPAGEAAQSRQCFGARASGFRTLADAYEFIRQYYDESSSPAVSFEQRMAEISREVRATGSYTHTSAELAFGARVAWRNSARCIGRLYWQGLHVRDRRLIEEPADVADECFQHLREATRGGAIRPTITVFAPDTPGHAGPRIHNEQLIRYAGYRLDNAHIMGDPRSAEVTTKAIELGWQPPDPLGRFDVLPLVITGAGGRTEVHDVPKDVVLEVPIRHPEYPCFDDLRLRWYAVPAISNMALSFGGIRYPAAPFNGWYLNTEIGARNFTDANRYGLLATVARSLELPMDSVRTLWKDRALVELVRAVQWSFDEAGVTMSNHHTESERFLEHVVREERSGRTCPADWSWIVPPISGGATAVFHRYYAEPDPTVRPAFVPLDEAQ